MKYLLIKLLARRSGRRLKNVSPLKMVPSNLTAGQKRVVQAYLEIKKDQSLAGSALYREIAKKLFLKVSPTNTNSYVRHVIEEVYLPSVSEDSLA